MERDESSSKHRPDETDITSTQETSTVKSSSNLLQEDSESSSPTNEVHQAAAAVEPPGTTTVMVTVTSKPHSSSGPSSGATAVAIIMPVLFLAAALGLLLLWCRRRNGRSNVSNLLSFAHRCRWNSTDDGSPSSPQSAEMAFKSEKVDRDWDAAKGGKSRERLEGRQHRSPPKAQEFSKWISAVSPSRKRHHQPHQRHGQRAAPRKVRTLDISKPSNFVHKSSSSGSQKRLLAEQLAAAEVAIQDPPSVDDYETSLPSYTAAMKRTKPAPLDIRAAVSAGKAMVKHSEQRRQEAQEKQKTIPPATHTRTASRREDVPKALQPRIRSLRRKPIPLVPLPKAPGEDAATPLSQTHDSPVDKPLQKLRESKSSMLRPDSGSTFFCQGSALLVGDKLSKFKGKNDSKIPEETKQEDIKRLTVTHVDPRMSMMSIATTGPSGAKAPPNSMAVGDTDEVEKRKSARAVMAEKYQGQIEQ